MSKFPLTLSVSNSFGLKATKNLPHLVLFADKDGKILGNLDGNHISRASTLIKVSAFKGTLGDSVSDHSLDGSHPALTVIGVGALDKLANNIQKLGKPTYQAIKAGKKATILWGDTI